MHATVCSGWYGQTASLGVSSVKDDFDIGLTFASVPHRRVCQRNAPRDDEEISIGHTNPVPSKSSVSRHVKTRATGGNFSVLRAVQTGDD